LSAQSELNKVAKDVVVSLEYTLTVDGEVVDSSEENGVLDYLQGHQNIIPGLESAMEGMTTGETKKVMVEAKDAYGEYDPEAVEEIALSDFPEDIPLEVGIELAVDDGENGPVSAVIVKVSEDTVTLNYNHPLAGKALSFDVKVVSLRAATAEELEHGHVHSEEEDDCDCDCDCGGSCSCN
jgi:FKBP-type peptidyl-prolyl cis-trans isomerase SlyD